jgi:outer membrane protein OmpA-like peptidoglycan-associated protein
MNTRSPLKSSAAAALCGAALLLLAQSALAADAVTPVREPAPSQAGQLSFKLEPGVAWPLTKPQSQLFKLGGGASLKALWSINRYLDIGPAMTVVVLPTKTSGQESGRAFAYGAGLRLKGPHFYRNGEKATSLSPWVDADAYYVRTGPLNRFGYDAGAGVSFPVGSNKAVWIGPFVRYFQIHQQVRSGWDNRDAKILLVGVSAEVGPGVRRRSVVKAFAPCSDSDGDGVCDADDRCPDVAGTAENFGCPAYKKLVVQPDKLELREKLFFEWDQARLQPESFPVLDEVVVALKENASFKVQIDGHASSEGTYDHNQTLSEKRAEAVLDYLATHGIDRGRLVSKGFSSSVPVATNTTEAGREANRRVEFVVQFIILDDEGI